MERGAKAQSDWLISLLTASATLIHRLAFCLFSFFPRFHHHHHQLDILGHRPNRVAIYHCIAFIFARTHTNTYPFSRIRLHLEPLIGHSSKKAMSTHQQQQHQQQQQHMATATGQVDGVDYQDPNSKAIRFLCGLKQHPADESAAIQSFYETLQPDERGWAQRFLRSNHPRITLLGFLYSYASSSPRAIRSQPSNVRGSTFYNDASRTWSVLRLADMSSQAAPQHLWLPDLGCIAAIQRAWPDLTPGAHAALLLNSYLPSDPEERAATISVAANLLDSCTSYDEFEQELHLLIASAAVVPPSNGAPNAAPLATAVPRSSTNAATPAATLPPINIFNQLAARSSTGAPLAEHIQPPRQQAMDAPAAAAAALPTRGARLNDSTSAPPAPARLTLDRHAFRAYSQARSTASTTFQQPTASARATS